MIAWNYGLGSTIPRAPPPAFVVLSRPVVLSLPSVPIPVSSLILAGFFFSCSLLCDMVLSHLLTYFSFLFLFWFGKGLLRTKYSCDSCQKTVETEEWVWNVGGFEFDLLIQPQHSQDSIVTSLSFLDILSETTI